ncbi:flavin reductase family protein [Nocardia caishijiensis]|uniref:Flavin reductase (DIM6/NTAB) family NADH-FMN oxidoreductase RutF n=1 Tax=Nocardia caishijiensis TaxID=184756 RepID=A0ABQ6YI24_9NOCA|nr:flavin reductase family protein [Nocardia caishijiensis]KAF0845437.1 flavin reductase (DIM6/NTAB) family NADH-FMN oxidoreductase RutF [Nocardia caishijiensis]
MSADSEPTDAFDAVIAAADAPVWIVTTVAEDRRAGCLVGFATQASINPRRFLVALSESNHTYETVAAATHLAVHLLTADHFELARLFATTTGDDTDKFARCDWHAGPYGLPILAGAAGWFAGEIIERVDLGDHLGVVLAPVAAAAPSTDRAILHLGAVAELTPGHPA